MPSANLELLIIKKYVSESIRRLLNFLSQWLDNLKHWLLLALAKIIWNHSFSTFVVVFYWYIQKLLIVLPINYQLISILFTQYRYWYQSNTFICSCEYLNFSVVVSEGLVRSSPLLPSTSSYFRNVSQIVFWKDAESD